MKRPEARAEEIGYSIAAFYLDKFKGNYDLAGQAVRRLEVTDIKVDPATGDVEISLARPGLLIGSQGENINSLRAYLKRKIRIVEHFSWNDILVPQDYNHLF